jgi:hypothetical protein
MLRRILALATLLAAGLLGAHVPGANVASEQIAGVKKVYVEKFGGGEGADQIRDMVIATIQRTNLFVLTENPERADTLLRGSAEDLIYTENFQSNEGVTARLSPYGSTGSGSTRASARLTAGVSIGDHDSVHQQERKHEASASVRLVNRDGDVIWSTIQESQGAKFRSAAADVAARIGRQLAADYAKVLERRVVATVEGVPGE